MALWGGRFSEPADDALRRLNDSLPYDRRLYRQDIEGSLAYSQAIADAGVITQPESQEIQAGLKQVLEEFSAGKFEFGPDDEDIHSAVERRLIELVGPVGGKLHTGRSRNDQVATDMRLWTMHALSEIDTLLADVQSAVLKQSEHHLNTLMPGFTHLQPAQPISVAHWMMSFFWMFQRDRERLRDVLRHTSVMPLGSGALAGTPFAIDRKKLAFQLGFSSYSHNSLDAISDRDFVVEALCACALIGTHLSRLGEDIILFSNPLFGFVQLDDRYSTGSSLMPQKRNADPMELARGKAGRLVGNLAGVLTMLKGLPTGYNKDLQEDKEALFDSIDTLKTLLPVLEAVISTLNVNKHQTSKALIQEMLATDLADYLVVKGIPFREAHHIIGRVVQFASENRLQLSEVPLKRLQEYSSVFGEDVVEVFDFERAVARKHADGGTAPEAVRRQIEHAYDLIQSMSRVGFNAQ
jgi:argininosuccinate lyase